MTNFDPIPDEEASNGTPASHQDPRVARDPFEALLNWQDADDLEAEEPAYEADAHLEDGLLEPQSEAPVPEDLLARWFQMEAGEGWSETLPQPDLPAAEESLALLDAVMVEHEEASEPPQEPRPESPDAGRAVDAEGWWIGPGAHPQNRAAEEPPADALALVEPPEAPLLAVPDTAWTAEILETPDPEPWREPQPLLESALAAGMPAEAEEPAVLSPEAAVEAETGWMEVGNSDPPTGKAPEAGLPFPDLSELHALLNEAKYDPETEPVEEIPDLPGELTLAESQAGPEPADAFPLAAPEVCGHAPEAIAESQNQLQAEAAAEPAADPAAEPVVEPVASAEGSEDASSGPWGFIPAGGFSPAGSYLEAHPESIAEPPPAPEQPAVTAGPEMAETAPPPEAASLTEALQDPQDPEAPEPAPPAPGGEDLGWFIGGPDANPFESAYEVAALETRGTPGALPEALVQPVPAAAAPRDELSSNAPLAPPAPDEAPPPGDSPHLVLPDALTVSSLEQVLADFTASAKALAALLVTRQGALIASAGRMQSIDSTAVAALVAGMFAATREVARLLGENEFSMLLQQGEQRHIHISLVGPEAMMVVVFEDQLRAGAIRHAARKAGEAAARLLALPTPQKLDESVSASLNSDQFKEFAFNLIDRIFH